MFNWVVLLFIGLSSPAGSSGLYAPPGARAGGLGDTFTAMAIGVEALWWNLAGVAWTKGVEARVERGRPFQLAALETSGGAVAYGLGRMDGGISVTGFGDEGYRETTLGFTLATRPRRGRAAVGIGAKWMGVGGRDLPSQSFTIFDIGLRVAGTRWAEGAVGWNATGQRVDALSQGSAAGIALQVTPRVWIGVDVWKKVGVRTGASTGVEAILHRRLVGRIGWGGYPDRMSAGFGVMAHRVRIDTSVSLDPWNLPSRLPCGAVNAGFLTVSDPASILEILPLSPPSSVGIHASNHWT